MRVWFVWLLVLGFLGLGPDPATAQDLGGSLHIGTLGLGGRVTLPLRDQLNLRGGLDVQPFSIERDFSDVNYDLNLPSPSLWAMLDLHPGGSGFRVSAGAVYFATELELAGTPLENVDIGGEEYTPQQIGSLIGSLGTAQFAPYFGIGWGDSTGGGIGFSADLGVAIHGTPDVRLRATGPIGDEPAFVSDLEAELADINDEISALKVYPILNLGVSFGL